jgi:hypothetical protein
MLYLKYNTGKWIMSRFLIIAFKMGYLAYFGRYFSKPVRVLSL